MDTNHLTRRKELALHLLTRLKKSYSRLDEVSSEVGNNSNGYYEKVFMERQKELDSLMDDYQKNVGRIREINNEITAAINEWYQFIKDENQTQKIIFPIKYYLGKRSLNKKISLLNEENSSITINNRFLRGKLAELEHQLEIEAIVLAKSGGDYQVYENLLLEQKSVIQELQYLLPTIPGLCPADISPDRIDELLQKIAV